MSYIAGHRRKNAEDYVIDVINIVISAIVIVVTIYPLLHVIFVSMLPDLKYLPNATILTKLQRFTFENYGFIFSSAMWGQAYVVTIARTILGTALCVLFTMIVGYGLSRPGLRFRNAYMVILVITMYFGGGIVPYYFLLKTLRLFNTFAVYIVPGMLSTFLVIISIAYFRNDITAEIHEAALIDGANDLQVFTRIVVPLSKPLMATMALFVGVGNWSSWFDSAYFVRDDDLRTVPYRMMQQINQVTATDALTSGHVENVVHNVSSQGVIMASIIVTIIPIMCVYPFLQKYFIKGMMIGAVKG